MTLSYPVTATASSANLLVAGSFNNLHIVTLKDGTELASTITLPTNKPIIKLAISPDESHIAVVDDAKSLRVYTAPTSSSHAQLLNTRPATKKCSSVTFSPDGQMILYSDKVGDVYSYPLQANTAEDARRPSLLAVQTDPTINPDASLLLGHVSIITDTIVTATSTGKGRIITSDRDEHIRISRYPLSYVVDKYLFGSEGFVSAIHIAPVPPTEGSSGTTLLSAGGERWMRIWDWEQGVQVGRVDVMSAVLPNRRVRSAMRRDKRKGVIQGGKDEGESTFYTAPEGWMLPTGQGICVKKITSVQVEGKTVVIFFSEGAAALHSFTLANGANPGEVSTLPLDSPVLDVTLIPGSTDLFVSLDTAFGVLKHNPSPTAPPATPDLSEEALAKMAQDTLIISASSDGTLSLSSRANPLAASLKAESNTATPDQLSKLSDLYPDLGLLPKWSGEDAEEAGEGGGGAGDGASEAGTAMTSSGARSPFSYTPEELAQMPVKQLGRLKAQGVNVMEYIQQKTGAKGKKSGLNPNSNGNDAKRQKTDEAEAEEGALNGQ